MAWALRSMDSGENQIIWLFVRQKYTDQK